jgi:hypothetical protein
MLFIRNKNKLEFYKLIELEMNKHSYSEAVYEKAHSLSS